MDRVAEHGLHVWDAQTGTRPYSLHEPEASVYALAWSRDGAGLVSGGSDGRLIWWDLRMAELLPGSGPMHVNSPFPPERRT